jgi:GT2 family glycosyltransferase
VADRAVVGYVHPGTVRAEFMASLLAIAPVRTLPVQSGPRISEARNLLVRRFLEGDATWLFMVDTDMVFAADAVDRLVAAADPVERPVVGGLTYCPGLLGAEPDPTMFQRVDVRGEPGLIHYRDWPRGECVQVAATGAAALLIHRTALERVAKTAEDPAAPWFCESRLGGLLIGEDLTFCLRCADAGIPVWVHTGVQFGHVKSVMLGTVT